MCSMVQQAGAESEHAASRNRDGSAVSYTYAYVCYHLVW